MKQMKISLWLKSIVVVLGLMGIAFFGFLTWYAVCMKYEETSGYLWSFIFFSWYTAFLCYVVLFQFWKVCTQIGRDNSFSPENARSFHRMALCGIAAGAGFALRILWLGITGELTLGFFLFILAEILLSLVFCTLCEALSRLVLNAYEVKRENELTI